MNDVRACLDTVRCEARIPVEIRGKTPPKAAMRALL